MLQQEINVKELIAQARRNEDIANRLFDIETRIMDITKGKEFFGELLEAVQNAFSADEAWLSFTEDAIAGPLDTLLRYLEEPVYALYRCSNHAFEKLIKNSREPRLVNRNVNDFSPLGSEACFSKIRSIAVLPLMLDGQLVGSLNFGSYDVKRYDPSKDCFFLKQLAVKTSICLSSVVAHEQLSFFATRDALTCLKNRREMEETLEKELSRGAREGFETSLIFVDCDDFKLVNDTYGHDCGDSYLKYVADTISGMIRKGDTAFRFAGDEFVILLPNLDRDGAEKTAARIRTHLSQTPLEYRDALIPVYLSFGVANTSEISSEKSTCNSQQLLKEADSRLYEMKAKKHR